MSLTVITPPDEDVLAVTLADVKKNSVIEHDDDDDLLEDILLPGAIEHVENEVGKAFVSRALRLSLDCFPANGEIKIPLGPVLEITSIKYYRDASSPQYVTIDPSVYDIDRGVRPNVIHLRHGQRWPAPDRQRNAVRIDYRAGYIDTSASPRAGKIPAPLRNCVLMIVDDTYRNRGAQDTIELHVNKAVEAMLYRYRDYEI